MASQEKELRCIIAICLSFLAIKNVSCNFYSSIHNMESLVNAEEYLLGTLDRYFQNVKRTNERIRSLLNEIESNFEEIEKGPAGHFTNPLNALKTIKRIAVDWKKLEPILLIDRDGQDFSARFTIMASLGYANVTVEELEGASKAIVRLQDSYNLTTSEFADGVLMNYESDTELSAHDCFRLGHVFFEQGNYQYSTKWLLQARVLLYQELEENSLNDEDDEGENGEDDEGENDEDEVHKINEKMTADFPQLRDVDVMEFLASSLFHVGNYKMAEILNKELLTQEPTNQYGLKNKELYESHVVAERSRFVELNRRPSFPGISESDELIYPICRGDMHQTPKEQRNLRCRYVNNKVPFCLIAPFKMEELNHDPFIATYYDVIYDGEMQRIINETENELQSSEVDDMDEKTQTDVHTSQTALLHYENHRFLDAIHKRLQHITGLNPIDGDSLEVVNYGIGGHDEAHYDFSNNPNEAYPGLGNPILTALFYISDVEIGGDTVFPLLHLAVPPVKGSMLIWFNQHDSLEPDYRTLHASCPVLIGSKWICSQSFHEVGQELTRPCSLKQYEDISLPDIEMSSDSDNTYLYTN